MESNKSFGFNCINERIFRKFISSLINSTNFVLFVDSRSGWSGSLSVGKRRIFSNDIVRLKCLDFDSFIEIDDERCFLKKYSFISY